MKAEYCQFNNLVPTGPEQAATFTNSSTCILDDGQPVGPIEVQVGVRQGDPLAPLLFDLAIEPLLVKLRQVLEGIQTPWGRFVNGVFADDANVGASSSDGPAFVSALDQYCTASNSRINFHKSAYVPLQLGPPSAPQWVTALGLRIHDPSVPFRVLGYDLVLTPDGVQEDWDALYTRLERVSSDIVRRHISLQGRCLLTTSKLFGRLWYKCRLSSPSCQQIKRFTKLGWSTVWNSHAALAPSMLIGRRPRLQGGVNFLSPATEIPALQAQWIVSFFSHASLWSPAFQFALNQQPGGVFLLAHSMSSRLIKRFPPCWQSILTSWTRLRPHWDTDVSVWTPQDALAFPLPFTHSALYPTGFRLADVLAYDPSTTHLTLLEESAIRRRFANAAPGRVCDAVQRLQSPSDYVAYHLLQMLVSSFLPLPSLSPSPLSILFDHLLVADTSLRRLTTTRARRFLDSLERVPEALDWSSRAISQLAVPPLDIWKRVWRGPLLPRHRETHYKLLMNALPLGSRIRRFAPERAHCPHCPHAPQTLRHFIHACPLAQQVWSDLRSALRLSTPVSLRQALFSWSTGSSRFLGRGYGFRLQAGHAVALHVLWTAHCRAVYGGTCSSRAEISNRFRAQLHRHFRTLQHSHHAHLIGDLPILG